VEDKNTMTSVKFDSTEIVSTTYIPRFFKHESDPEIQANLADLARDDGAILVSDRNGSKKILVQGILTASSQANLETAIDSFKELFRRVGKNLDISWAGGTNNRRYVATCVRHEFDRDHFHLLYVPWTAEFVVPSGVGEDTSETQNITNETFNTQTANSSGYYKSLTYSGSARPRPRITVIASGSTSDAAGYEIKLGETGERIIFTRSSGLNNNNLELDCRNKTVKYGGSSVAYYGIFPKFTPAISQSIYIKVGDIVAAQFDGTGATADTEMPIYGGTVVKPAQSFIVPYGDSTFQGVSLLLRKVGTIATDLTIRIETDSSGHPSGTLADANATFTITAATFTDAFFDWRLINSTNKFTLQANTKYWIVCASTGGDASNYFAWTRYNGNPYKNGNCTSYQSGAGTWIDEPSNDLAFKVLFGGKFDGSKTYTVNGYYYKRYL
jgi:hypothetical protein